MTDVDTRRPSSPGIQPGDRTMVLLLQLAAAADRYLATASDDHLEAAGRRRHLEFVLGQAWDAIGVDRRPTGAHRNLPHTPIYSRTNLPTDATWGAYMKDGPTQMARITGPFAAITIDGNAAYCADGWIALDTAGHPYPIAAGQAGVYRPVRHTDPPRHG